MKTITHEGLFWTETHEHSEFEERRITGNKLLASLKRLDKLPFINADIKFSDETWDFSHVTDLPISPGTLKFDFAKTPDKYKDLLKFMTLILIFNRNHKIQTIKDIFGYANRFCMYLEKQGITSLSEITLTTVRKYFLQLGEVSVSTFDTYRKQMKTLLNFYVLNFAPIEDSKQIFAYLSERNLTKLKNHKEASKIPDIPQDYFNQLLSLMIETMNSPSEPDQNRGLAAAIVLLTQTGLRIGEFMAVKTNAVKPQTIFGGEKTAHYMAYGTYKNSKTDGKSKEAYTIINELAYSAYNILTSVFDVYRKRLDSDILYITPFATKAPMGTNAIPNQLLVFLLRNHTKIDCINVSDKYPELRTYNVGKLIREREVDRDKYCKGLSDTDTISFPLSHQFRVRLCTELYRQGVPLAFIQRHMNHLTSDMQDYYVRPRKEIQEKQNYAEAVLRTVLTNEATLLGSTSDSVISNINNFIRAGNYNVKKDIDQIISELTRKMPIRSKLGGVCIKSGPIIECSKENISDQLYCSYNMCPNLFHFYYMVDITYKNFQSQLKIINYNKENGFTRAAEKETNKLKWITEKGLLPELDDLKKEIGNKGADIIKSKHPQISWFVDNINEVYEEVAQWLA